MVDEGPKQLIESLYTPVLVFNGDRCLSSMNSAGENLLSISARKACGMRANEILPFSPQFSEIINRSIESGINFTERGVTLVLNSERSITVDCVVTPVADNEDKREVILELIDTHAMYRLMNEEKLTVLAHAARDSLRGMAHEIKNPLGGLRGAAQLLEKELPDEALKEYTRIIIHEADRLRNLIDRMSSHNSKLIVSTVNIHEVLEYVSSLIDAESDIHLQINRDYDPSVPDIEADKEQLIQALLNIFRNASDATGNHGNVCIITRIKRKCTIQHDLHKLAIQIEITDDGPGVPEEIHDLLFYPMVTGRVDGTGLGLSISQSIIQAHGGIIEYERKDSRTRFRILIPVK